MKNILITFLLLSICFAAKGQSANCPTVTTNGPTEVKAGEELTFTANVSGGDANVSPTYNWMVSNGTISSGQGTSTITVSTTPELANATITATVDVGGYDRSCSTSSSYTASIIELPAKVKVKAKPKSTKVKVKTR